MPTNPTGKQLLKASFALFRQDPQMVWLPVLAALAAVVAFAAVAGPIVAGIGVNSVGVVLGVFVGGVAANAAALLFQVAVVFAATDRIEGRAPTVSGSIAKAWGRKGTILEWAVLSSVVGTLVRALERRFGFVGALLGIVSAVAWAVATFFVLPVLAYEDLGPIATLRRSTSVLKDRWGTVARGSLRFGMLFIGWVLAAFGVLAVAAASAHSAPIVAAVLAAVGVIGLVAIVMFASTAGIYLRTVLYRFATGRPVPNLGVDLGSAMARSTRSRLL